MFNLLKKDADFSMLTRPANVEYHRVFDTVRETGSPHFLHGAAVTLWQNRLAVCFAFNRGEENSATEELLISFSDDRGMTWTKAENIAAPSGRADSHGVFLPRDDGLWCFASSFNGLGEPPLSSKGHRLIHFKDLKMKARRFDGVRWEDMGAAAEGFWPLGAPVRTADGNWLLAGCDTRWYAAAALSRGGDLTKWDVVKPDTDGEVFTEAGAWVSDDGGSVLLVMRNQSVLTDGRYHAAVSLSTDGGRSFGECEISDLPMAAVKPFCGRLSDGRYYLLFNESIPGKPAARDRLLIGIGNGGDFGLESFYVVDEGYAAPSGRRLALSYPYAYEHEGRLYIAYSYESAPGMGRNHNDAMLAVLRTDEL